MTNPASPEPVERCSDAYLNDPFYRAARLLGHSKPEAEQRAREQGPANGSTFHEVARLYAEVARLRSELASVRALSAHNEEAARLLRICASESEDSALDWPAMAAWLSEDAALRKDQTDGD